MKRLFSLFLVMALIFTFSFSILGQQNVDYDSKYCDVELSIDDVVFIEVKGNDTDAVGKDEGFTKDEVDSGVAFFDNIHTVEVSSTTNFIVAANLRSTDGTHDSFFEDTYFNGDSIDDQNFPDNYATITDPQTDPQGLGEHAFYSHNLVYIRALRSPINDSSVNAAPVLIGDSGASGSIPTHFSDQSNWHHIDSVGNYESPDDSTGDNTYEIIFKGGSTSGYTPATADVDFALDLKFAKDKEVELPSGTYNFRVNYLVLER